MAVETSDDGSNEERILDATLVLLAQRGVAGVSMRAVAAEAGVSVGLANYHFQNKISLISAALRRIGETDMELVTPIVEGSSAEQLDHALRHALDQSFLESEYLSLRLQLWSLAGVDPVFAEINQLAQQRYLAGLADLLAAARPDLDRGEVEQRAADILVVQNGVWLTAILIPDPAAVERAVDRTIELAHAP